MYWQKGIRQMRLGLYLVIKGIVLFLIGLAAKDFHQFSYSPQGYLTGISYPLHPVGVGLIVGSILLFAYGFYLIVKEKVHT